MMVAEFASSRRSTLEAVPKIFGDVRAGCHPDIRATRFRNEIKEAALLCLILNVDNRGFDVDF